MNQQEAPHIVERPEGAEGLTVGEEIPSTDSLPAVSGGQSVDPFFASSSIAGLEHLGRAIVDANGVMSGSPANYEHLRGRGTGPAPAEVQTLNEQAQAHIAELFPQ